MEVDDNVEGNVPLLDSEKPDQEVSKSPENPPVEDEEEPPAKKSKVAEEALKKIEAAKLLKEKEKQEAEEKAKNAHKNELDKFWKTVKDDPTDFTGWTHLLQFVDGKNEVEAGEEAFNAFLKRYPYCYGYWKKFADFQKRNGTPERVMEVFDQVCAFLVRVKCMHCHLGIAPERSAHYYWDYFLSVPYTFLLG
jgi:pre-mRNA-processing factor 39